MTLNSSGMIVSGLRQSIGSMRRGFCTVSLGAIIMLSLSGLSCTKDESVVPPTAPVEKPIPDGMVRFHFPLVVGTVWSYSYSSTYSSRSGEGTSKTGVQSWTLVSADTITFPRQYHLQAREDYTVSSRSLVGSSGTTYRDSSWAEHADTPFTITVGADSIVLHTILRYYVLEAERIPRNVYPWQTQVRVSGEGPAGAMSSFEVIYEVGKGLTSFSSSLSAMSGSSAVRFWLNTVTVPAL